MSRGLLALLLILITLIFFYGYTGQEVQSHEVTFALGLILGVLFGWWTGGGRILRKLRREDHEKAETTYKQRTEKHL